MSRDCDYLLVWDANSPDGAAAKALEALLTSGTHTSARNVVLLDVRTLYWSCAKHGLALSDIEFPTPPDQVLERCDGDTFADVTAQLNGKKP